MLCNIDKSCCKVNLWNALADRKAFTFLVRTRLFALPIRLVRSDLSTRKPDSYYAQCGESKRMHALVANVFHYFLNPRGRTATIVEHRHGAGPMHVLALDLLDKRGPGKMLGAGETWRPIALLLQALHFLCSRAQQHSSTSCCTCS